MAHSTNKINVYLEIGTKRAFAGALDWPGWCRGGRDEQTALQTLLDYSPRYARVLRGTRLGFGEPANVSEFNVIERLKGDSTTNFGAPAIAPSSDTEPVNDDGIRRFHKLLNACWQIFDEAARAAAGKTLRLGPRGGGRDVEKIISHVVGSDEGYLSAVGWKLEKNEEKDLAKKFARTRQAVLDALTSAAKDEIPTRGPRGGIRWSARYFVRRVAWHVLDHAWEIEDRIT